MLINHRSSTGTRRTQVYVRHHLSDVAIEKGVLKKLRRATETAIVFHSRSVHALSALKKKKEE